MTTAQLIFRIILPIDEGENVKSCDIDFLGKNADKLSAQWKKLQLKEYNKNKKFAQKIEHKIEKLEKDIKTSTSSKSPLWKFKQTKKEDALDKEQEIKRLKDFLKEFKLYLFDDGTLHATAEKFLKLNGFMHKKTEINKECTVYTYTWEKD